MRPRAADRTIPHEGPATVAEAASLSGISRWRWRLRVLLIMVRPIRSTLIGAVLLRSVRFPALVPPVFVRRAAAPAAILLWARPFPAVASSADLFPAVLFPTASISVTFGWAC